MSEESIASYIAEMLGDMAESIEEHKGFVLVRVDPSKLVEAARKLRESGFDHVKSVTVVDRPDDGVFEVGYHVSSYLDERLAQHIVELVTVIPRDSAELPSLTEVWLSAEFQEREAYEQFGVIFRGHPDLRPILLSPPVAELRPLRKDFKVVEEGIYKEESKGG